VSTGRLQQLTITRYVGRPPCTRPCTRLSAPTAGRHPLRKSTKMLITAHCAGALLTTGRKQLSHVRPTTGRSQILRRLSWIARMMSRALNVLRHRPVARAICVMWSFNYVLVVASRSSNSLYFMLLLFSSSSSSCCCSGDWPSSKKPKAQSFQIGLGWNLTGNVLHVHSLLIEWRTRIFDVMPNFQDGGHDVIPHRSASIWWVHTQRRPAAAYAVQPRYHFCVQFLIHSTFVLVLFIGPNPIQSALRAAIS